MLLDEGDLVLADADAAMNRYASGDDTAFAVVYDAIAPRIEGYLRRRLRREVLVEDVVQQTFLQMHAKRGTFRSGAKVLPWALCIARNFMIDLGRKSSRDASTEVVDDANIERAWFAAAAETGEELVVAREMRERIDEVFATLTAHQRAAFELTKGDGLSHAEAAEVLGTTVMGIKQCVHKVYKKLERALEEERPEVRERIGATG
jgi:RNA polymerase sigma-70 factor (ECF subfamily)